jgi:lysophospholipase L1-like esterase
LRTCNRGVAGHGVADVIDRLDTALVDPRAVVLLIGTNDLPPARRNADIAPIAAAMTELVARIRKMSPHAPLLINAVLPRSAAHRATIEALNQAFLGIAAHAGAIWIDTWPAFAGPDGAIRAEYSYDELHLTAEGYRVWAELLRPQIALVA